MVVKDALAALTDAREVLGVDRNQLLIALAVVVFASWNVYSYASSYRPEVDVPTQGVASGILGPWKASYNFFGSAGCMVTEGYAKYAPTGGMFKIATFPRYLIFVTDWKHIEEMNCAPHNLLSRKKAIQTTMSSKYTIGMHEEDDPFFTRIIQESLTHKLSTILDDVSNEAALAFQENLKVGDDWTKVNIWDVMVPVSSRTSNLGAPLCRNKEYLQACLRYATRAFITGLTLDMLPRIFRPFLAWCMLNRAKRVRELMRFLAPIFEERKEKMRTLGDKWTDKPKDSIQWIIEEARGTCIDTTERMTMHILLLNFVSTHTTSQSITHALIDLAANPHFIPELREEIKTVLAEEGGWTKPGLTKMKKLDSALKESQRINGVGAFVMSNFCVKDFKFADSDTVFPAGTFLNVPANAVHLDTSIYENPLEYDAFRFSKMREQEGQGAKHQMVSTTKEFLAFGYGKHACPGRFFATNVMKVMMSYIILNYDFKLQSGKRPENLYFGSNCAPPFGTELLFKKIESNES
ncbi:hypothetical protein RUND412_009197 [Rhizina undulata]